MENLLTKEEIKEVLRSAELNPALRHPDAISFGNQRTSIMTITPENGLVLIQGDSDTGFNHIRNRHSYWSEKTYWRKGDKESIDSPSQFGRESMPIVDYVQIIDGLFDSSNFNIERNKNPQLFDMYSGVSTSKNLGEAKYHMLLYKDTLIVHTLYPHTKKKNKKKIVDYVRGKPKGELSINPARAVIAVPYSNKSGKVIYSFQIALDYVTKMEKGFIVNHEIEKSADVYERPIEKIVELNRLIQDIDMVDLTEIEKIIKQLDKK